MHELVKNEKKESSRARPSPPSLQQTPRTGPTALLSNSGSSSLSIEEQQQKRIAARAAAAMAQVLQRRREPRSLLMWGDRKKAIIKSYPDGGQEIIVPQTLTPEQEHYEFPPRSRFLKKLATSTAERRQLSVLQDHIIVPSSPTTVGADTNTPVAATAIVYPTEPSTIIPTKQTTTTTTTTTTMKQPDQLALQEWFSKKEIVTTASLHNRNSKSSVNKDRAVIDWMNDVERSSKTLLLKKQRQHSVKPSPTPSSCNNSNKIQFKSDAGKRWANSITANTSLIPPDDTLRKHYVPRRLLSSRLKSPVHNNNNETDHVEHAASKIQKIWKDYQSNHNRLATAETQIGMAAMATTGQRTPIAGMVQLVQMLHNSLKVQQQRSHNRMEQLELLLQQETKKRQLAEETMKRLEASSGRHHEKEEAYQTLLFRVSELEESVKRKGQLLQAKNNTLSPRKQSASSIKKSSVSSPQQPMTRKPSVPMSNKPTRSLARTSSLANAGVMALPKRSTPLVSSGRRMTTTATTTRSNSIKK